MATQRVYHQKQAITLTETGVSYSNVLSFHRMEYAKQLEIKADVTAGDGSVVFSMQISDDNVTWFDAENSSFTIAAINKGGIIIDSQGKYMRVKLDYTHASDDTVMDLFTLVR